MTGGLRRFAFTLGVAAIAAAGAAAAPSAAGAQTLKLEIRPRLGDTLRMRLDQRVEVTGDGVGGQRADSADGGGATGGGGGAGGGGGGATTQTTTLQMLTRAIVQRSDAAWTTVLIVTDSVMVSGSGGPLPGWAEQARRSLAGHRMRLRIAPDGHAEAADAGDRADELQATLAQMPAMLPRGAIEVGDTWVQVMRLPAGSPGGARNREGRIRATFRLDSVGRGGELAYVSMHGMLARESAPAEHNVPGYEMSGTLVGSMIVDRRRAWMTSSRTTLQVQTVLTPPSGSRAKPMKVRMKVTQWLRAL